MSEEAHWRVMSKITGVERSLQRRTTVGSLHSEQRAEANDLHRQLEQVFKDEVKTQLRAMEVFAQIGEKRLPSEHIAGVQTTPDLAGGGVIPRRDEVITNTATGLTIDTVGRRKTFTRQVEDTGEPRGVLCPKDMSRLVAIPTGQFSPVVKPVGHPGGAETVIGQQRKGYRTQAGGCHIPSMVGVRVTSNNIPESSCWPPTGRCASCGLEGCRHPQATCIAQGRQCNRCGSQGHLARTCTKEMNLHTNGGKSRTERKAPGTDAWFRPPGRQQEDVVN